MRLGIAVMIAAAGLDCAGIFGFRDSVLRLALYCLVGFVAGMFYAANAIRWHRPLRGLIFLLAMLAFIIFEFARAYSVTGLHDGDREAHDLPTALYFSVVTITTVGYGDVQAVGIARVLAACEAIMGTLFLGMLVAMLVRWLEALGERDSMSPNIAIQQRNHLEKANAQQVAPPNAGSRRD